MRRISFIVFLCVIGNLYFSKAQNVRLKNADRQPVEGAVVVFSPLNVSEKGTVVISNNKGEAWVMGMPLPLIRKISMIGFLDRVDTVITSTTMEEIVLTTVPKTMGEVTITGNHIPGYQRDAVVPVQVLKSADIEKRGAVTVKDLLAQELNLRVSYDPSLGSSLSMQGTGGEHIKILVDGVPVIGRQNGNIDLGQINLSNIDRVEVVRGPMSVLYGTDALGGVINLITKTPLKQQLSATVTGFYETTGQYNTDVTVNYGNKNTAASLNLGRNFFDGWDPESNDSRSQLWNPREQYFGNVKLTRTIKTLKLTLQSAWFQEEVINKSEPFVTPYVAYANDQYYHTTRFNLQLVAEKKFKNNGVLNFTGAGSAYEYVKNTMRKDMVELSEQLTPDPLDDDTTNFNSFFSRATYVWADPKARWSVLGGVDANYEVGSGKRIDDATHNMTDVAGYMSIDYKPIERVTLRPSVRAIYNSRFDAPFVPSLNVLVKITDKITARSSFSKGYRAPSLKEQYLNFVDNGIHNVQGNPDLLAEKSNQWLASLEFRKGGQDYVLTVEPGFFYNDIRNKISLVQYDISSTLYTYVNLDHFNSRGMELKSRLAKKQFTVSAGISYTGTWGTFEGDVDQPEVAWYPEVNAAADYTFKKTKTTVSLFWKYYGDRPVFLMSGDGSIQRFDNESFQMMDASVRQQLVKERLSVTLGVRNLLDVTNVRAVSGGGAHSGGNGGEAPVAMGTCFFAKNFDDNKMRSFLYISILMIVALTGCQKEDEAIVLPAPGPVQQVMAELGSNYDDQVYVSLSKGTMHTVSYRTFDLAFEASPQGRHIYLNGAKYMFLSHTGNADITLADSAGSSWQVDAEHLGDDSTAFGNWWSSASVNSNGCSNVVVVDRGRLDHTGADRFRKIQVIEADDVHYRIRFSNIDNSGLTEMDIPKNPNYSLMYFSFNNGGTIVQQAPPKNDWDFVFTKYTHVYYDEPLTSPFRYYPVTGVIINFWNDVSGSVAKKDSTPDYVPFMDFEYGHVYPMPFTYKADVVGFDWKYYDFGSSQYYIRPDLYFVLKDNQGFYYKLRMVDFYDHSGNKGTVTFEFQRI